MFQPSAFSLSHLPFSILFGSGFALSAFNLNPPVKIQLNSGPNPRLPTTAAHWEAIAQLILSLRNQRVILDADLARLYGVETRALNQAMKRNQDRFPADFMFQLSQEEASGLIFQFGISKGRGGRRHFPYAFTEQGVAMLSSVLRSPRAVQVNVAIMRAFVRLRETLSLHKDLAHKLAELERKIASHDASIQSLFEAIRQNVHRA